MAKTTIRQLVRDFPEMRRRADAGETIRIVSRRRAYIFRAEGPVTPGLVGCCAALAPQSGAGSSVGPVESPDAWSANR
jgi:hypothetical protein